MLYDNDIAGADYLQCCAWRGWKWKHAS